MFDLNHIDFIKTDEAHGYRSYSFVGIKRNEDSDRLEFWLPLGFKDFDEEYGNTKQFFFKMYKTFKTYLNRRQEELKIEEITRDRDGIIEGEGGFSFVNENKEQTLFYGKLNSIDKILEGYDELRISSLEKKTQKSQEIDYSKIHRYMHQAVYLDDDVIYLDEMNIAKAILVKSGHPILKLFCFIYSEIKKELGEDEELPERVFDLSESFKEENLNPNSGLFAEETFEDTLNILKDALEEIDTKTAFKDEDYWHFFEAIEAFLYGEREENEEDIYWGFSSFYDIWEDMCQTYVLTQEPYKERVLFADLKGYLKNFKEISPNPFEMQLNGVRPRYLRPDLVLEGRCQRLELFYSKRITKYNRNAYSIVFHDYQNLRINYPNIFYKYREVVKEEENFLHPGRKFFYIYEEDYKDFLKVIDSEIETIENNLPIKIIDFKYMRVWDYERYSPFYSDENGENKVKEDIHKQLIYEWSVQKNWARKTESEFWIPFYSDDLEMFEEVEKVQNPHFNQSKVKIKKINFRVLQDYYIQSTTL